MRKPVIAGNWKMNKTVSEAITLVNDLKNRVADVDDVTLVVCPTFLCIKSVADTLKGSNIHVGAQDMFWETLLIVFKEMKLPTIRNFSPLWENNKLQSAEADQNKNNSQLTIFKSALVCLAKSELSF